MDTYTKAIRSHIQTEVLVVGSGSAGATAAIAAAQMGAQTLLVERYGFMGGISTQVLDTFYGFYTPGAAARGKWSAASPIWWWPNWTGAA